MNDRHRCYGLAIILLIFTLILQGCGLPKPLVTKDRMTELKRHFVGHEFVFRTDWTNQLRIYKGKPTHYCFTTPHQREKCLKNAEKHKQLLTQAGTVARITDVEQQSTWYLFVEYKTEQNKTGHIIIETVHLENWAMHGPLAHAKWTDQTATVANVEDLLTRSTIRFLDKTTMDSKEVETALPAPPQQPTLTAAPTSALTPVLATVAQPAIRQFEAGVKPTRVKHGDTLKLMLNYVVESGNRETIEVTETRSLLFNGKTLPGYPKEKIDRKSSGRQTSAFRQNIPSKARPGSYTYKGEVCIPAGCTSRLVRFTIEP